MRDLGHPSRFSPPVPSGAVLMSSFVCTNRRGHLCISAALVLLLYPLHEATIHSSRFKRARLTISRRKHAGAAWRRDRSPPFASPALAGSHAWPVLFHTTVPNSRKCSRAGSDRSYPRADGSGKSDAISNLNTQEGASQVRRGKPIHAPAARPRRR